MSKRAPHPTAHTAEPSHPRRISRREFLMGAATVAAGLLAGCCPASPLVPDSAIRRPEIIRFYPDTPSKVVHAHHAGVWTGAPQGDLGDDTLLSPEALHQMLDAAITELTGIADAGDAWAALFDPDERVAIKVCTYGGGRGGSEIFTHVPLVMAVADCLQEVDIPAEQIVIYDRQTAELKGANFTINRSDPGVRCYATGYEGSWDLMGNNIKLASVLLQSDALINIPLLKSHGIGGMSFAMKSHYGSFNRPQDFHQGKIERAIAELNALEPIRNRTRLTIGDALVASTTPHGSRPYWTLDVVGDSILMSFDPVAHDAIGLEMLNAFAGTGGGTRQVIKIAEKWLKNAAELGLGTNDPANIDLVELNLG
ncbi:MAG: DUF362 domain-containing protein [Anaerolineae bacterium]|nr:DUF362 domain-containing protein [Anaerolineae bacterium]